MGDYYISSPYCHHHCNRTLIVHADSRNIHQKLTKLTPMFSDLCRICLKSGGVIANKNPVVVERQIICAEDRTKAKSQ